MLGIVEGQVLYAESPGARWVRDERS